MVEKRAEREIPQQWRDTVAEHLERWIAKQPKVGGKPPSERALAPLLGISQFALNKLRNRKGPFGLHILIALREPLGLTLDELIGFEPNRQTIRRIIQEELEGHNREQKASPKKQAAK